MGKRPPLDSSSFSYSYSSSKVVRTSIGDESEDEDAHDLPIPRRPAPRRLPRPALIRARSRRRESFQSLPA